jgi:hypothetical protein
MDKGYWCESEGCLNYGGCERFCTTKNEEVGATTPISGCELFLVYDKNRASKGSICFAHTEPWASLVLGTDDRNMTAACKAAGADVKSAVFTLPNNDHVFHVQRAAGVYKMSPTDAAETCASQNGARLCTLQEMTDAQKYADAQWCACSWVSDSSKAYYPMQSGGTGGCGGPLPGVRNCGDMGANGNGGLADVCCTKPLGASAYVKHGQISTSTRTIFAVQSWEGDKKFPIGVRTDVCKAFNASVCTLAQLTSAQQSGASWCACSWVADSNNAHYPMQNSNDAGGCGGPVGGVRNCGDMVANGNAGMADVCCVTA